MIVTKDSPIFGQLGGMHLIHVNAKGLPTLKNGGTFPYPDGTIFADDVHDFSVKDGSYVEGKQEGDSARRMGILRSTEAVFSAAVQGTIR